ncbi:polyamine oxidase-like [Iris pallida]|uniref:Polyamine oxidase-like n=1 Tax=Iris pallida TaxID=29817 RepID=A0AAX6H6W6_IRIPA|nr:polyamine oxidase-like [Iris pallida]
METKLTVALLFVAHLLTTAAAAPSVIVVGAGMSGISSAKILSDAGIKDILILEATDRIGGRIHKTEFGGISVEKGANWVEGVNGDQLNPILTMAEELRLRRVQSDYSNISSNTYKQESGLYDSALVQKALDLSDTVSEQGEKLTSTLPKSGREDISVLTFQRLQNHVPSDPVDMVVDYYTYDYEFAEPPRVTSLQNTVPLSTFANFGEDIQFVCDRRGYESVVYHVAHQFLKTDKNGTIVDPRLLLNKVVRKISQSRSGVEVTTEDGSVYKADYVMVSVSIGVLQTKLIDFVPNLPVVRKISQSRSGVEVTTEDGSVYKADYVMVSVSIGVLQTKLIDFVPNLPNWKIMALYQFDMAVYTKIFLKFPHRFWPLGKGTKFFLYASERRGYYPVWQHFEDEYPGAAVLMVTVTDEESRRIEQQSDSETKAEVMEVLRSMFGKNVPEATDIFVPRWWSDRFFKGTFSNWPLGVNRYEFDQIRAPVGKVYFTGEHTSEHYNGYVHGAYLAGIDSANMMIRCIKYGFCKIQIKAKDA